MPLDSSAGEPEPARPCPTCGAVAGGYDELVAVLKAEGAWGKFVVEFKRGAVVLNSLNLDYKTPAAAIRARRLALQERTGS
jgi:hypothetical protein